MFLLHSAADSPPTQRHLRPWALATPIAVLLVALPLLRPLRHPSPQGMSDDEAGQLLTTASIVEHGTLSLDQTLADEPAMTPSSQAMVRGPAGGLYTDQSPTLAALLAIPYWVLSQFHLTLRNSPVLLPYLLTLLGVTLPAAGAAALVYRMGRLLELPRPWRSALAAIVVFGGGMISYSVAIAPYTPAATLVLCSAGAMIHVALSKHPIRDIGWLAIAGGCALLAASIDPAALVFPIPLFLCIAFFRWPVSRRIMGMGIFLVGMILPAMLHLSLTERITGDWKPGFAHPELALAAPPVDGDDSDQAGVFRSALNTGGRFTASLVGDHGVLSHFPVLLVGIAGIAAVMHRNWPLVTKALALTAAIGAGIVAVEYSIHVTDTRSAMFANRWFIVFMPLLLFWCGAWVRRPHHPWTWAVAGTLLAISVVISILGATDPLPREGYDRYTAAGAIQRLIAHEQAPIAVLHAGTHGGLGEEVLPASTQGGLGADWSKMPTASARS